MDGHETDLVTGHKHGMVHVYGIDDDTYDIFPRIFESCDIPSLQVRRVSRTTTSTSSSAGQFIRVSGLTLYRKVSVCMVTMKPGPLDGSLQGGVTVLMEFRHTAACQLSGESCHPHLRFQLDPCVSGLTLVSLASDTTGALVATSNVQHHHFNALLGYVEPLHSMLMSGLRDTDADAWIHRRPAALRLR
jgi:hypothetical protein